MCVSSSSRVCVASVHSRMRHAAIAACGVAALVVAVLVVRRRRTLTLQSSEELKPVASNPTADLERKPEVAKKAADDPARATDAEQKAFRSFCEESGCDAEEVRAFYEATRPPPPEGVGGGGGRSTVHMDQLRELSGTLTSSAESKAGEAEGGADGRTWRWEQTSDGDESEVLVRFTLPRPATKKEVKVIFGVQRLSVTVAGDTLFDSQLYGKCRTDECTWSLVKQTASEANSSEIVHELQVLLSVADHKGANFRKWPALCAGGVAW